MGARRMAWPVISVCTGLTIGVQYLNPTKWDSWELSLMSHTRPMWHLNNRNNYFLKDTSLERYGRDGSVLAEDLGLVPSSYAISKTAVIHFQVIQWPLLTSSAWGTHTVHIHMNRQSTLKHKINPFKISLRTWKDKLGRKYSQNVRYLHVGVVWVSSDWEIRYTGWRDGWGDERSSTGSPFPS